MKEGRKAREEHNNEMEEYYYSTSDLPCRKHPPSSSGGICPYCLNDRLVNLVCSDCGEQRLSSCSCSEISSNRNSCTVDVGSVGRVSFLIENERNETLVPNSSKPQFPEKTEDLMALKRSSSRCVEGKKGGIWRIGKLFRKKREKECGKSVGGFDEKSESWMVDHVVVSRSRSLCSFRGGGLWSEDGGDSIFSGARSSISAARSSGVNGGIMLDSGRRSGYSETEPRRSGFDGDKKDYGFDSENGNDLRSARKGGILDVDNGLNRRIFSLRESDFKGMDESRFIDLKLDYSLESKPEFSGSKMGVLADSYSAFGSMRGSDLIGQEYGRPFGNLVDDRILTSGGSCRMNVNERGIKRGRKSLKGWRWIFRHNPNWGSGRKKDEDLMFRT